MRPVQELTSSGWVWGVLRVPSWCGGCEGSREPGWVQTELEAP